MRRSPSCRVLVADSLTEFQLGIPLSIFFHLFYLSRAIYVFVVNGATAAAAGRPDDVDAARARPKPLSLFRPFFAPSAPSLVRSPFPRPFGDRHLDYSHSRCARRELRRRSSCYCRRRRRRRCGNGDADNNKLGSGDQQFANIKRMPHGFYIPLSHAYSILHNYSSCSVGKIR